MKDIVKNSVKAGNILISVGFPIEIFLFFTSGYSLANGNYGACIINFLIGLGMAKIVGDAISRNVQLNLMEVKNGKSNIKN